MIIKGFELSESVVMEIGKFTILWADFENKISNNCNSGKIWEFSKTRNISDQLLKDFSNKLKGRVDLCGEDVLTYVRYNLVPQGARNPSDRDLKAIQDFIEYNGENLVTGALLAIYRIRNNLLHGLKREISNLEGQQELFKSINNILKSI